MKIELIIVKFLNHSLTHDSASGSKTIELDKKTMMVDALKYIEDYCNEMGFEVLTPFMEGSACYYHLVKK